MEIRKMTAVYFSPTGNAKKVAKAIAGACAEALSVSLEEFDYTLPSAREHTREFSPEDLVIVCTPTYAGRIPNKTLPYVQNAFTGNGALAVPVAVFGNRNFDNCLIELRNELEAHGFHTIAGAGVPTEHVFFDGLGTGRPDREDLDRLAAFGREIAKKSVALEEIPEKIDVRGDDPVGAYYTPLGTDGKPAVFLKAKPKVDLDACIGCGRCSEVCPMGSVSPTQSEVCTGVCIKCQACIKECPMGARYFDDAAFLSHVQMLAENYTRRTEAEFFL